MATRAGRGVKIAAMSLLATVFLCQCETQQPKVTTRSSTYSFDQKMWGSQAGGSNGDTEKIKNKFTNHGFTIDEEGNFKADRTDLYGDSEAKGTKGMFRTKEAKLKQAKLGTKTFKTPEYLKMQDFKGIKDARESGNLAREADFKKSRWRDGKKLFSSNTKDTAEYASFNTGENKMGKKVFSTGNNAAMTTAMENSPEATATLKSNGYKPNKSLTKDDVKKMINPNGYAQGVGLSN